MKEMKPIDQLFNATRNDMDAYLYALGNWALSGEPKPDPADYGLYSEKPENEAR